MKLSDIQQDGLKELFNIGIGRAASSLNELIDMNVELTIPEVYVAKIEDAGHVLGIKDGKKLNIVEQHYECSFSGKAALLFPEEDAAKLISVLSGEELNSLDLDAVMQGTLNEVGNILINSLLGSISNSLNEKMDFSLPLCKNLKSDEFFTSEMSGDLDTVVACNANFTIKEIQVTGVFVMYIGVKAVDILLSIISKQYG